jgi:hypothetical protein
MTATIDQKLYGYIERLNPAQKKSLLGFIKTILPPDEDELYTIAQYNRELDEADAAVNRGEFDTNDEVFAMTQKIIDARK